MNTTLTAIKARAKAQQGFTLIELIIVIAIIGILAAIAIGVYGNIQQKARVNAVQQTASNFKAALSAALLDDDPNTTGATVAAAMFPPGSRVVLSGGENSIGAGWCGFVSWADIEANVPSVEIGDQNRDCAV